MPFEYINLFLIEANGIPVHGVVGRDAIWRDDVLSEFCVVPFQLFDLQFDEMSRGCHMIPFR